MTVLDFFVQVCIFFSPSEISILCWEERHTHPYSIRWRKQLITAHLGCNHCESALIRLELMFNTSHADGLSIYNPPVAFRPWTIPTPITCPIAPQARVSVAENPAGSPVWRPESLSTSLSPAVDFLLAEGARPNLPANNINVVDATMIRLVEEPM